MLLPNKFNGRCFQNMMKALVMMDGLHIERATFSVNGDWADGSGWTDVLEKDILEKADIITSERTGSKN